MANQVVSSLAALGIALAPALMKFADVSKDSGLEVAEDAEAQCVSQDSAPVHPRYQSTGTEARLSEGSVVQVLSKRKDWRHVAYVLDGSAGVGWVMAGYLGSCDQPNKEGTDTARKKTPAGVSLQALDSSQLAESPHVLFGVPTDSDPSDDFLMNHGAYVLSYNKKRDDPNWVAWKLTAADLGDEDRQDDFRADDDLPDGFLQVRPSDYGGSGFDKGHMCPSAHRTVTADVNSLTFLMTNMQPQVHGLNAGPWKSLETYERKLADEKNKDVYVVAGGLFARNPTTIGQGVAVPKANFRITVVLDAGQRLRDVTAATPVYAVEMPNDPSAAGHKWTEFEVAVDQVEQDSGYDFLSALPDRLENQIEANVSPGP
jgi:DNA/RNA endonuclease G (NUC1)